MTAITILIALPVIAAFLPDLLFYRFYSDIKAIMGYFIQLIIKFFPLKDKLNWSCYYE